MKTSSGDHRLPDSWVVAKIGDLCDAVNGRAFKSGEWKQSGLPIIRIQNLKDADAPFNYFDGALEDRYRVEPGDLLFAWSGTPGTSFGAFIWKGPQGSLNQHIFNILFDRNAIDTRYLAYALNEQVRHFIQQAQGGVGLAHITKSKFLASSIPLAPRPEQVRLVEAIETQLTRLDAAVAALERVQANLKRYRASVLKAAVEGRLVPTEAELARKEGRDYEPASELLKRILAERRRRWEESELAAMKAKGKTPKDDKWKAKYKDPVAPDTKGLQELPEGWCWSSCDQVGDVTGGLTKNPKRDALPIQLPYLRVANVYANELRLEDVQSIGLTEAEMPRVLLRALDLLVVEGNGSADQIGRVALWDATIDPCVHQNHIIKVRFFVQKLSRWSLSWLLSPLGRIHVGRMASSTSGLHTLSLSKVKRLPIPLPPIAEQERVTRSVESADSIVETIEHELQKNRRRCMRLRQSILKWAFEGKLVDQDSNDEPASVLLERIRAEREAAKANEKPKAKRNGRKRNAA